jgi:hypothetical protein
MMDGLNLDPGLRKAYNQQTHQRLIAESARARLIESAKNQDPSQNEVIQYSMVEKLKAIGQIVRESGSNIITVIRAKNETINA